MTRADGAGFVVLLVAYVVAYVVVPLILRLRERWRMLRAREHAQQLVDYAEAAHLNDCRHGLHRTTLDAEYRDVYFQTDPYAREIRERCIDCGLTVPFGRVTTFTTPHRKKKAHG
jgi:hypothetical protein